MKFIVAFMVFLILPFAYAAPVQEDLDEINAKIGSCGDDFKYKNVGFYDKDTEDSYTLVINDSGKFSEIINGTENADFMVKASESKIRENRDKIKVYNYFLYFSVPLKVQWHAFRTMRKCNR